MEFTYTAPVIKTQENRKQEFEKAFLVSSNDEILKTKILPFDFSNPPVDPIEFAHFLVRTMLERGGIGLAANQIGYPYRVFAMAGEPNFVCYNPIIIGHGEQEEKAKEGCLSHHNFFVKVKRWKSIKTRFTMPNGEATTKVFAGLTARVFQHELDHLDGESIKTRSSFLDREKAYKEKMKLDKK